MEYWGHYGGDEKVFFTGLYGGCGAIYLLLKLHSIYLRNFLIFVPTCLGFETLVGTAATKKANIPRGLSAVFAERGRRATWMGWGAVRHAARDLYGGGEVQYGG